MPERRAAVISDDFWAGQRTGWDRDPRLIDPVIDHPFWALHHGPSGTALVLHVLRGGWSDAAIHELRRSFESALPGRHAARVLAFGTLRLNLFLGVVAHDREDLADADEVLRRARWAFDRTVARSKGAEPPGPGPDEVQELPEPGGPTGLAFQLAEASMGAAEYVDVADGADPDFRRAEWAKLHQTTGIDFRDRIYSYRSRL